MKIKIFDTCFSNPSDPNDPTVNVYFELTKELTRLQKKPRAGRAKRVSRSVQN